MHPTFHHELAADRVADLHHYAARERMAKSARHVQAHRNLSRPAPAVTALARRALTPARGHSPAPTR